MASRWHPIWIAATCGVILAVVRIPVWADETPASERFAREVQPIFEAHCVKCHGAEVQRSGLDLGSAAGLLRGGDSGPVVVAGKPDESVLFELVKEGAMPPAKTSRLNDSEIDTLRAWIADGAPVDAAAIAAAQSTAPTQHDVVPILLLRCTVCHGRSRQEGGLDLRTKESMLRGGKSGPAIVLGRPSESLLVKRVQSGDMPPRRQMVSVSVKPMAPNELEVIEKWIAAGAPESSAPPASVSDQADPLVSAADREFWAFQAPRRAAAPKVRASELVRNSIDAFILARLEAVGLTFASPADRVTLLRRVYFDLTGLPPPAAEVAAFAEDPSPQAYEKLVDRLLASPEYGERWARHWLDVSGYADSEGKREQDLERPWAFRYRDYVVAALSADRPYDRFLIEQIAGDELFDYENVDEVTDEIYSALVATGFLRMGPDGTWANITNFVPDRLEVIGDALDVLSAGVMGLTMKCSRCHDHKFDPIPQRDYYRLAAVFQGAYDQHAWLRPGAAKQYPFRARKFSPRHLPYVLPAERARYAAEKSAVESKIAAAQRILDEAETQLRRKLLAERLAGLPDELQADVKKAIETPAAKRDEVQAYLRSKFGEQLKIDRGELEERDADFKNLRVETDKRVAALQQQLPPPPQIRALWDTGEASPTYILRRGDYRRAGRRVEPGVPSVLMNASSSFAVQPPWPGAKQTGRRLALARWLVGPSHPLTARVMVNRVWRHHFGRGIVRTLGNFGRTGAPPTHPDLLDWLATEFVRSGWSLKRLHRLLVTSATYRQTSTVSAQSAALDADGSLYSRMPLRRLDAEEIRDAMVDVAGKLDRRRFGPAVPVEARKDGLVTEIGGERGWRRSLYIQQIRKKPLTIFESFDVPAMNPNCIERKQSNVALQALYLLNNRRVWELADAFAAAVMSEGDDSLERQVVRVYRRGLGRLPTNSELNAAVATLRELETAWSESPETGGDAAAEEATSSPFTASTPASVTARQRALRSLCHTIMNSAAFLYVD